MTEYFDGQGKLLYDRYVRKVTFLYVSAGG